MKLVRWGFRGLHMPMVATESELICTNKQISVGLGCTKESLWQAYRNHKSEMDELRYIKDIPKDFLAAQRGTKILRVVSDN